MLAAHRVFGRHALPLALILAAIAAALPAQARAEDDQSLTAQAATNYLRAAAVPLQAGDLAEAATILEEGLDRSLPTPELLTMLADVYRRQGRLTAAASAAEEALGRDPAYAPAHLQLGDIYLDLGWLESAAASYRAALAADPQAAAARDRLVHCLAQAGLLRAAEQECRAFLAVDETTALCIALGEVLGQLERFQEAMAAFDRALQLDPRCADAHGQRAGLLCRLGHYEDAATAARAALAIDPDHAAAHGWLGLASAHCADYLSAYSHAVKAEQAGLDMSEVWGLLQQQN